MDVLSISQIISHSLRGEFYQINVSIDYVLYVYNLYVYNLLLFTIFRETNCNVATKFDAYIFYHRNEIEVQHILQSLGQGFQRTHFAV